MRVTFGTKLLLGYVALVALHMWLARKLTLPLLLYDEFGHLTTAAYFAGLDWSSITSTTTYYAWGYGLLLSPLLRWATDPYRIYHGALFVNALSVSAVFPLAWVLGRRLAPTAAPTTLLLAAAAVALYPSYLALANFAWSESVLSALFWVTAVGFACR